MIDAYEREGRFFGIARLDLEAKSPTVEFGLTLGGYRALKRILSLRPFDRMLGLKYRYFVAGSFGKGVAGIRVELGMAAKNLDVKVPQELASNLLWFARVDNPKALTHLTEV